MTNRPQQETQESERRPAMPPGWRRAFCKILCRDAFLAIAGALVVCFLLAFVRDAEGNLRLDSHEVLRLLLKPECYLSVLATVLCAFSLEAAIWLGSSAIGLELAVVQRYPRLVQAVKRLLLVGLATGRGHWDEQAASARIDAIAMRFDPLKRDPYDGECERFQTVNTALNYFPNWMRFTDIRKPAEWEISDDLHKYNLAFLRSVLCRQVPWVKRDGGVTYVTLSNEIKAAIEQCLRNYHEACSDKPIGHARRWIGCRNWQHQGANENDRRQLASALFGRPDDIEAAARIAKVCADGLRNGPYPCNSCSERDQCKKVNVKQVLVALKSGLRGVTSVYGASNIYAPYDYWPNGQMHDLIRSFPPRVVVNGNGCPAESLNCVRVVFWSQESFRSPWIRDVLQLWDNSLLVPVFSVDPKAGLPSKYQGHDRMALLNTGLNCNELLQ